VTQKYVAHFLKSWDYCTGAERQHSLPVPLSLFLQNDANICRAFFRNLRLLLQVRSGNIALLFPFRFFRKVMQKYVAHFLQVRSGNITSLFPFRFFSQKYFAHFLEKLGLLYRCVAATLPPCSRSLFFAVTQKYVAHFFKSGYYGTFTGAERQHRLSVPLSLFFAVTQKYVIRI
jgi:hypothetical protein